MDEALAFGAWLSYSGDVDFVQGSLISDQYLRTYLTGDGAPKMIYRQLDMPEYLGIIHRTRDVGLPIPSAVVAVGSTAEQDDELPAIETSYVVTYVSDLGEESGASAASNIVSRWDGSTGAVKLIFQPANIPDYITHYRIYRIELQGVFQFVADMPVDKYDFIDVVSSAELGEPIPSIDWVAPDPRMQGLTAMPHGFLMGFWDNTIAFSEPYQGHAWPIKYQLSLNEKIVGIKISANGAVVTTTGAPYLVYGTHPEGMSILKIDSVEACIAKRSMVDMGEYVVYASSNGLIVAGGKEVINITEDYVTSEQWLNRFNPASIVAYRWEDNYLAFYENPESGEKEAFIFSRRDGFVFFDEHCTAAFFDDRTGTLFINQNGQLKRWHDGAYKNMLWRSKEFLLTAGIGFNACKIDSERYLTGEDAITLQYNRNGQPIYSRPVLDSQPFRLPDQSRQRKANIIVGGKGAVEFIQLTNAMTELI